MRKKKKLQVGAFKVARSYTEGKMFSIYKQPANTSSFSWDDKQHLQQETNRTQLVQAVAGAVGDLIEAVTNITLAITTIPVMYHFTSCRHRACEDKLWHSCSRRNLEPAQATRTPHHKQKTTLDASRGARGFDTSGSLKKVAVLGKFDLLSKFDIGPDSTAPGTHTVESDFSTLKRKKGPQRGRLSNYSMEAELQSRRVDEIGDEVAHILALMLLITHEQQTHHSVVVGALKAALAWLVYHVNSRSF
ncbi:hypothetical protein GQ600_13811 [Phytophthora cactorum]|nr:hypothetical protein GQ600_13811 [Phytophthora cactorum]